MFRVSWPQRITHVHALLLVSACTPTPAAQPAPESGSESDSESGSESESDSGADLPTHDTSVSGLVIDELGAPIADLPITLCGAVCLIATTDATGRFEFTNVDPGVKVLEPALVPVDGDLEAAVTTWTRFFDFVSVTEGEHIEFDEAFVMLRVDNTIGPLAGPQLLQPLASLSVGFDADAIVDAGALPVGIDAPWFGAREVPLELWPKHGYEGWTILAVWSLAVWDLEVPDGFAVDATLPRALAPGAEVAFLVADYEYGFQNGVFFEEPALLSDDGQTLSTPPEAGLDRATMWLAVTK